MIDWAKPLRVKGDNRPAADLGIRGVLTNRGARLVECGSGMDARCWYFDESGQGTESSKSGQIELENVPESPSSPPAAIDWSRPIRAVLLDDTVIPAIDLGFIFGSGCHLVVADYGYDVGSSFLFIEGNGRSRGLSSVRRVENVPGTASVGVERAGRSIKPLSAPLDAGIPTDHNDLSDAVASSVGPIDRMVTGIDIGREPSQPAIQPGTMSDNFIARAFTDAAPPPETGHQRRYVDGIESGTIRTSYGPSGPVHGLTPPVAVSQGSPAETWIKKQQGGERVSEKPDTPKPDSPQGNSSAGSMDPRDAVLRDMKPARLSLILTPGGLDPYHRRCACRECTAIRHAARRILGQIAMSCELSSVPVEVTLINKIDTKLIAAALRTALGYGEYEMI